MIKTLKNTIKIKKPELLCPAGDLEKLETAVRFGADAVYVGAGPFSLRAEQTSFSIEDLKKGIKFAKKHGVKVYLAMNIFAYDSDLKEMANYLRKASSAGIDAVIVSDPGLVSLVRKTNKKLKIHLSTQANTLNTEAVKFWKKQGVRRIVLGRELSLEQAEQIKKNVPEMEIELFVHGAMCMSYSGRCLISKFMTGKSANRGECTHPCRWEYNLIERQRPDETFEIQEDNRGTYIMNSKDLCLINRIPELVKAGIDSFKIEGRMKSAYYVALTTKVYRQAIDSIKFNPKELENISHRQYTTGFYFEEDDKELMADGSNVRNYTFVGVVQKNASENQIEVKARNYFGLNDELEIIDPRAEEIKKIKIKSIRKLNGDTIKEAHNQYHVIVKAEGVENVSAFSVLRRMELDIK